jgi:hypothetical protein
MYYYIKLVVVVVTFIPGTRFPDFWFTTILVPMMDKCHLIMNLELKSFLQREVFLLPWRFLDLFILPGLISDEEAEIVNRCRAQQLEQVFCEGEEDGMDREIDGTNSTDSLSVKSVAETRTSRIKYRNKNNSSFSSPIARSRVAASNMHLRKFSRDHGSVGLSTSRRASAAAAAPKHRQKQSVRKKNSLPKDTSEASTLASKRHSGKNPTSRSRRPPKSAFSSDSTEKGSTVSSGASRTDKKQTEQAGTSKPEVDNSQNNGAGLNCRLRKFITGDSNIRVRDYLFDINMPALPATVPAQTNTLEMKEDVQKSSVHPIRTAKVVQRKKKVNMSLDRKMFKKKVGDIHERRNTPRKNKPTPTSRRYRENTNVPSNNILAKKGSGKTEQSQKDTNNITVRRSRRHASVQSRKNTSPGIESTK